MSFIAVWASLLPQITCQNYVNECMNSLTSKLII